MTIPNTFANLSGTLQLSLLDENFTYLLNNFGLSVLNRSGSTITVPTTVGNLSVLDRSGSTILVPVA